MGEVPLYHIPDARIHAHGVHASSLFCPGEREREGAREREREAERQRQSGRGRKREGGREREGEREGERERASERWRVMDYSQAWGLSDLKSHGS